MPIRGAWLGEQREPHRTRKLVVVATGHAEVYHGAPCQAYCRELEEAEAKPR